MSQKYISLHGIQKTLKNLNTCLEDVSRKIYNHFMVPKRRIAHPNRGIESLRHTEKQMGSGSTQPVVGIPERLWIPKRVCVK